MVNDDLYVAIMRRFDSLTDEWAPHASDDRRNTEAAVLALVNAGFAEARYAASFEMGATKRSPPRRATITFTKLGGGLSQVEICQQLLTRHLPDWFNAAGELRGRTDIRLALAAPTHLRRATPTDPQAAVDYLAEIGRGESNATPPQPARLAVESVGRLESPIALPAGADDEPPPQPAPAQPAKRKRSTVAHEATDKLRAVLLKHHRYEDGSVLVDEPLAANETARLANAASASASRFFVKQFGGHLAYRRLCRDQTKLAAALRVLAGDVTPGELFAARPSDNVPDSGD